MKTYNFTIINKTNAKTINFQVTPSSMFFTEEMIEQEVKNQVKDFSNEKYLFYVSEGGTQIHSNIIR